MKISDLTILCLGSLNIYEVEFSYELKNIRLAFNFLNVENNVISKKIDKILFSDDISMVRTYYLKKFRWSFKKYGKKNLQLKEEEINSLALAILYLLRSYLKNSDANLLRILFSNTEEVKIRHIKNLVYEYTFFL